MNNPATSTEQRLREIAVTLSSIGNNGLVFATDVFDRQRYEQTRSAAAELMALISDGTPEQLLEIISAEHGYMTPKVDVRGGVFNDTGQILLIRDRSDEQWTLPGGWCDPLEPPSLAVEREVEEESGLTVRATKLAAVLDREKQGHQPVFAYHVYKMFFLCEKISDGTPSPIETLDVDWFDVNDLPALSHTRILPSQIQLLHDHWTKPDLPTAFD
ncbi:NUDIX hydrolase [Nocardia sp. alder85J]|uniref:NUDIX hydrolase n=1 Tax=Nocardia sp. alder85J TaxID=2862949 RepID=UPI001CD79112|nr:NUDIX hydrolase [Nocardia sp. alder85J]MCX4097934.1 NUDIX hydrolase [Nocardia sp. alder85J]